MTSDRLAQALGAPAPAGLDVLGDDATTRLAAMVDEAIVRQSAELDVAIQEGLGGLPWPLRRVVRSILFR